MKFRYNIERIFKTQPEVLEEKINTYLRKNSYRIIERGEGYIIFVEDKFSDRRKSRSDFYTRIGEGKFIFNRSIEGETRLQLIYLTSLSEYIFAVMLACAFGVYTSNLIMPIVCSLFLTVPILHKIYYLNTHVFDEIMDC